MESPWWIFHWLEVSVSIWALVVLLLWSKYFKSNHCLHLFPRHIRTTEKASAHSTVPGDGGGRKPVGRGLLDWVSLRLIDTPDVQWLVLDNCCYLEQMHPGECEIWGHAFRASSLRCSFFCFFLCVGEQFPFTSITSSTLTERNTQNRTCRFVVEDLESECLQNDTAATCLSGNYKEGKVRQLAGLHLRKHVVFVFQSIVVLFLETPG